jgi:hypothetical protein
MLWLLVIFLIGGLSFVIFHKPHVNTMGAGWVPPEKRQLPKASAPDQQVTAEGSGAVQEAAAQAAPQMPDTLDFNDLFGGKKPAQKQPGDRPNA